ncbi:MAG: DUF3631 domain-containing protein [Micromonosporaceae bacterium]|nr:DUF3631 domain-containing protein [Micromonosporaceae bacterium]
MVAIDDSLFNEPTEPDRVRPGRDAAAEVDRAIELIQQDQQAAGTGVLDQAAGWLARYLSVPSEHCITVLALWAAHTHATELFYVTPRLILDSAEPESGKTRVLELLNLLCRAPIFTMNTTIAALYRRLAAGPRTVLLDETDAVFAKGAAQNHEDLRALLNAGYKRGATVDRCVPKGNEITVVEFPAYAPAALAGIAGNMPPTITTRAVTIHMRRRAPGEHLAEFIEEDVIEEATKIREPLSWWIADTADELRGARPVMPDGVRDRQAEIWRALLAIADAAGGGWPDRAREACRHFVLATDPGELSLGVRLLADLRDLFGDRDRMASAEILTKLAALEEAPWGDMYGKPIDSRRLAKMIGKYGVKPKVVKFGDGTTHRGYLAEDLADVWRRYLPGDKRNQRNQRNPAASEVTEVTEVTHTSGCPDCTRLQTRYGADWLCHAHQPGPEATDD